jgi:hypothetical protein
MLIRENNNNNNNKTDIDIHTFLSNELIKEETFRFIFL